LHPRSNWKLNLLAGGVAFAAITAPAIGQIGIYIGRTPPPLRYEVRPAMPGEGYVWTEGYWGNQGGRYVWRAGAWQRPPYEGGYWSHPHYDHYQQGWQMHEGHWDHEDHGNQRNDDHGDHHDNGHR
jgi:hypothetical protein